MIIKGKMAGSMIKDKNDHTNKYFYVICIITLTLLFSFLSGCNDKIVEVETTSTESSAPEATMIYIYHPEENQIIVEEERYQLRQPDSTAASIEEIMSVISPYYEGVLDYTTYMLDTENEVTLEFTAREEYTEIYYLLSKAAIIRTLFQIPEISDIRMVIYSEDESVLSDELLDRTSVYYYDEDIE